MSGNLQRQAGITETKAGLTAKAQTPINLILEVMGDEMNASIHAPVSQRPWTVESDHLWPPLFSVTYNQPQLSSTY